MHLYSKNKKKNSKRQQLREEKFQCLRCWGREKQRDRLTAGRTDLDHEQGAEASLVVVGWGHTLHHTRHRVVHLTGPAAAWAHVEDLGQQFGVKAKSGNKSVNKWRKPVLFCTVHHCFQICNRLGQSFINKLELRNWPDSQVHRLRRPNHSDGEEHIVADFYSLELLLATSLFENRSLHQKIYPTVDRQKMAHIFTSSSLPSNSVKYESQLSPAQFRPGRSRWRWFPCSWGVLWLQWIPPLLLQP